MTARKMGEVCDGSGLQITVGTIPLGARRKCPNCGVQVSVTKYGSLRKHSKAVVRIRKAVAHRRRQEDGVAPANSSPGEVSLLELRDEAERIKLQLWLKFQRTRDPRYQRLHQFANALHKNLADMRDQEQMQRATHTMPKPKL